MALISMRELSFRVCDEDLMTSTEARTRLYKPELLPADAAVVAHIDATTDPTVLPDSGDDNGLDHATRWCNVLSLMADLARAVADY